MILLALELSERKGYFCDENLLNLVKKKKHSNERSVKINGGQQKIGNT